MKHVILLSVLSLFLITGCHNIGGGVRVSGHYSEGHNAPPAHAPAHGRRHHRYHYYPNAEFYFDIGRNMYFYLDSRAQWTFSVNLPIHLRHNLHNNYVEIEMDDDRPYRQHRHHKIKYKKHKTKYNRNNKEKRKYKKAKKKEKRKYKKVKKKHKKYDGKDDRRHKKGRRHEHD